MAAQLLPAKSMLPVRLRIYSDPEDAAMELGSTLGINDSESCLRC